MTVHFKDWLKKEQYQELVEEKINAPQHFLGIQEIEEGQVFAAFRPQAERMWVLSAGGKNLGEMEKVYTVSPAMGSGRFVFIFK
mgnify:CR=1 FL=1